MTNLIHKIVKKTVGYDLVESKPMSDDELKKWNEEREQVRNEWEESHPEEVAAIKAWEEKYKSRKPYTPTEEERKTLKELLHMNDSWFNTMDIYIFDDGDICVRTPQVSWMNLCGREWTIDLKKKKVSLTSMN